MKGGFDGGNSGSSYNLTNRLCTAHPALHDTSVRCDSLLTKEYTVADPARDYFGSLSS